ncbi:hypothetical protein FRC07_012215, partial [Ceratobasidium sp. 392]
MENTFETACPTLWALFGLLLNASAVKNAATAANKQGDYWTEATYQDISQTPLHTHSQSQTPQTSVETFADMPDEDDWGENLIDENLPDTEAGDSTAEQSAAGGGGESETSASTTSKEKKARSFRRQMERTNL